MLKFVKILSFVKILFGILGIENKFYILMEEVLYISIWLLNFVYVLSVKVFL